MAPALIFQGLPTPEEELLGYSFPLQHAPSKPQTSLPISNLDRKSQNAPTSNSAPSISKLELGDYTSEDDLLFDIIESMKLTGGCIVRNLVSIPTVNTMESEIRPYLDKVEQADCKSLTRFSCTPSISSCFINSCLTLRSSTTR
jgi:hypothetical protein